MPPRPGLGNTSSARCECNSLPFSCRHTIGYSWSYGRWYTASTSSILAMKRVLTFGRHQLLIAQGRNLFFLAVSTPRYPRYARYTLTPPYDLPRVAMSNDYDPREARNTPTSPALLLLRHRSRWVAQIAHVHLRQLSVRLPQTVVSLVRPSGH